MRSSIIGQAMRFSAALAAFALATIGSATAQNWPSKPITIIVPYGAGTGADLVARLWGDYLGQKTGQQVIVEDRPGAGATIGTAAFSKAAPDGYTLLLTGPSPIVNAPQLYKQLSYDPSKFVPVGMVMSTPIMVIVNNDVKANNVKELIALAKASPGGVAAGDIGAGSTFQLLNLMFEQAAGVKLTHVSYKGSPMMDLVAGRVNVMLDYPGQYAPYVKEGKVRILANLDSKRHEKYPNAPTIGEAGLPAYPDWLGWFAVYAPAGTPADVAARINAVLNDYLKSPEAAQKFATLEYIPWASTPAEVTKKTDHESAVLSKIIKENKISLD